MKPSPIKAVLGPTNTGKTHLAVERMCAHSSGMIGFPLRLLAREIYDRVVAIKGEKQVALLTGEERITPPDARYLLCTAEAMPLDRKPAFVAIDEAQLGANPERGHVFTDRLLNARGREETLILGSESLTPLVRKLVPEAEIVTRPRFSTLSYAGARKLSRLPKRSAIVAFSAEEVYAIAEMLRRFSGGAAVVMGALSPRTRNAQVAMFQAGEVDYLVATDAIGMGLNLNVAHVAFASFSKFDGRRQRRLTIPEMAQIAGRAGRHQQDGTFGSVGAEGHGFTPEEVAAIEDHQFAALNTLFWRNGRPSMDSVDALLGSLEQLPHDLLLRPSPESVDLAVLRRLASEPGVRAVADSDPALVARLWDVCGLPDFQKLGADHHSRTALKLWQDLSAGKRRIDADWFAAQLQRIDRTDGDMETLSARIAAVRTWCYIAHRADWLDDAPAWAARTREVEEKLSDALHDALTQRFVNRRTTVLLRDLKQARASLPVKIQENGAVSVDGEHIGKLDGFGFRVDPAARAGDQRILLAAAERHLHGELSTRAAALAAAPDKALRLNAVPGEMPEILWGETRVAVLTKGRSLTDPVIQLDPAIRRLDADAVQAIATRLKNWLQSEIAKHLAPVLAMAAAASDPETPAPLRALLGQLGEAGGVMARSVLESALTGIAKEDRPKLRALGLTIGSLDIYHPVLLKPAATLWRAALASLWRARPVPPLPVAGAVLLKPADDAARAGALIAGFRGVGDAWLRIDMVERLARQAHGARLADEGARNRPPAPVAAVAEGAVEVPVVEAEAEALPLPGYEIDAALATSLGLDEAGHRRLLGALGFRIVGGKGLAAPVASDAETETVAALAEDAPQSDASEDGTDTQADIALTVVPDAAPQPPEIAPVRWQWRGLARAPRREAPRRTRNDAKPDHAEGRKREQGRDTKGKPRAGDRKPAHAATPRSAVPPRPRAAPLNPHSPFAGLGALLGKAKETAE